MRIGTTFELNKQSIEKAIRLKVSDIVFHHLHPTVKLEQVQQFTLHNTGKLSQEGKNYAYTKVKNELEHLEIHYPKLFYYKGYDLKYALIKDIYWSLIIDNLIEHKCNELKRKGAKIIKLGASKYAAVELIKFFIRLVKPVLLTQNSLPDSHYKNKLAVRINSIASVSFFGQLLQKLGIENSVCFQSGLSDKPIDTANYMIKKGYLNFSFTRKRYFLLRDGFSFFPLLWKIRIQFLNLLLDTKRKQISALSEYELLANNNIKGILLCAAENEGEGIVAGMVAKRHNIKCSNFMNGTKAKDLINSFTTFDYWFMHDQKMQQMILSISNLKAENLPVVGHLMQDMVKGHSNSGSLNAWKETLKDKKIIALFSSNTYGVEQWDVINLLKKMLDENKDTAVLIRQHPDEKYPLEISHPRIILLPSFKDNSAASLFDLLQQAQLAISFGSTVSLQAAWFEIPSATVEYAEKSLLLYVDNKNVHHFNTIKKLEVFIQDSLTKVKSGTTTPNLTIPVAQKIATFLLQ